MGGTAVTSVCVPVAWSNINLGFFQVKEFIQEQACHTLTPDSGFRVRAPPLASESPPSVPGFLAPPFRVVPAPGPAAHTQTGSLQELVVARRHKNQHTPYPKLSQ